MFESVVLPAPFSPRSACTSPAARLEVDAVVRDDAREPLRDPAHANGGRQREAPDGPAPLASTDGCGDVPPPRASPEARPSRPSRSTPLTSHCIEYRSGRTLSVFPSGTTKLALLVVERPREDVELAGDDRLPLRGDRRLRLRRDLRPVRREAREAVLDRAVVEARLPGSVDRRLDALHVVRAPVVDRRRQPLLRRRLARVRVVADPRDALRLGDTPAAGLSTF